MNGAAESTQIWQGNRWLAQVRLVALGLGILLSLAAQWLLPNVLPISRIMLTLWLLAATDLGFLAKLLPRLQQQDDQKTAFLSLMGQAMADLLMLTVLLHWTGGPENPACFFYIVPVLAVSINLAPRWAYASAGAASLFYGALLILEGIGLLQHVHLVGLLPFCFYDAPTYLFGGWFLLSTALGMAAVCVSKACQRLRQRELELAQTNLACELRTGELAATNRRLNELAAARDAFMRYVTHELRAPVAAIQSYLRLIREGYVDKDRLPEVAERAEGRAEEVLQLIADLLDLGQVEKAQTQEEREAVSAEDTLMESLDMLRPSAVDKRVTITVELQPDRPLIFVNRRHLSLLWTNLLSNAIKYTPPDGKVRVSLHCDQENLHVDIGDTGIGIPDADRDKIFQEFYRSETARRFAPHGTGLGLAIVHRIVHLYNGTISFESELGKGTVFHVSLPLPSLRASCPYPRYQRPGEQKQELPNTLV